MTKKFFVTLFFLSISTTTFANIKVGLVLDKGGKDDKSFNSAAYAGATKAEKDLKIELKYVEATDTNAIENLHRNFARKNYDLVIGVGFAQTDAVKKVAAQFPKVKFAIVDGEITAANVRSLMFEEHEGSFLVGALAAMASKTHSVGFIGGMDIPLIRRFAMGYVAGAKYVDPKINISENYVGVTGEAWNNPAKSKELALAQYGKNIDVIFVAAGASNTGVFDAAEEKKKFAIGVDSNQNWMKPGTILTSMLKAVDVAVYETIKETQAGQFKAEVARFGLKNNGVDYTLDKHNEKLITPEMKKKVDEIKKKIIAGQIQVPDYYKKK
ncbi:BMP family ABC transporter substrate-binding protein [Bdellovibrio sp. SKB1291214]|uniref:BMP family lipoprotein n=1 Tax=Bdellovibrio sp. SKB1291214 TaxID=1732569 RepID=UPI000B51A70C|nr:BMP family ABC transporter substrate-binding protein [Bdellovibrio sp. SKB1291214]UYL10180.1 BMP family ABC transporter substrate-binding protein [Bdellovibrio sp. SKB1291214]